MMQKDGLPIGVGVYQHEGIADRGGTDSPSNYSAGVGVGVVILTSNSVSVAVGVARTRSSPIIARNCSWTAGG